MTKTATEYAFDLAHDSDPSTFWVSSAIPVWRGQAQDENRRFSEALSYVNEWRQYVYNKSLTRVGRYFDAQGHASYSELDYGCPVGFRQYLDVLDISRMTAADLCTSDDPSNHQGDTCPVHEA